MMDKLKPLHFQMTKLEFQVTRKCSGTPICKCNLLHIQVDLYACGHVCVQSQVLENKV